MLQSTLSSTDIQSIIEETLLQANVLGQSFDLNGELSPKSCIEPQVDARKAKMIEISFFDKKFSIPEYVSFIFNPSAEVSEIRANDKQEYLNKLTAKAKIDTKFTFFKSQFELDFGMTDKTTTESSYLKKSIVAHIAKLNLTEENKFTNQTFLDAVSALPKEITAENLDKFVLFFEKFGLYYTKSITLGGNVNIFYKIDKSTKLNEKDIKAIIDAQVGAVKTGSFNLTTDLKKKWEEQKSSFEINIKAAGGSSEYIQKMTAIDMKEMSEKSTSCYEDWAKSVNQFPSITSIELSPIYNLVPADRYDVIRRAFELFMPQFNPALSLSVRSSSYILPVDLDRIDRPIIKLNDQILVADNVSRAKKDISGYQVLILENLDGKLVPAYNHLFTIDLAHKYWSSIYKEFYDNMAAEIRKTNLLVKNNILIVCSYNISINCCPTGDFCDLIIECGAGEKIRFWRSHCNPGSMTGAYYVSSPVHYILASQIGSKSTLERLEGGYFDKELNSDLHLNFFRNVYQNNFDF